MGEWIGVIGIVLGAVSALLSALIFLLLVTLKNRSLSSYDHRKREVELSAVRSRYERDVAGLAERLSATEQRWLEVNNLVLEGQQHVADQPVSMTVQAGIPLLRELSIPLTEVDRHQIFVLTPFSNDEDGTYELIRAACRVLGYRCIRGDEEFKEGDILKHAVTEITKSWLVIANITSRNANVFYELGADRVTSRS